MRADLIEPGMCRFLMARRPVLHLICINELMINGSKESGKLSRIRCPDHPFRYAHADTWTISEVEINQPIPVVDARKWESLAKEKINDRA